MTMLTRQYILNHIGVDTTMITVNVDGVEKTGLMIRMEKYRWLINKMTNGLTVEDMKDYALIY